MNDWESNRWNQQLSYHVVGDGRTHLGKDYPSPFLRFHYWWGMQSAWCSLPQELSWSGPNRFRNSRMVTSMSWLQSCQRPWSSVLTWMVLASYRYPYRPQLKALPVARPSCQACSQLSSSASCSSLTTSCPTLRVLPLGSSLMDSSLQRERLRLGNRWICSQGKERRQDSWKANVNINLSTGRHVSRYGI